MIRLICGMMMFLMLCGCGNTALKDENLSIVCSAFSQYDWAVNIAEGTGADIKLLTEKGEDLHSYQPTVSDIAEITDCDIFIFVGGVSDKWAADLVNSVNKDEIITINMLQEHMHGHEHGQCDEHIWLSLKESKKIIEKITDAMCEADAENAEIYKINSENYIAELEKLDAEYEKTIKNAPKKSVIFCDRFPFKYLAEDYGLEYYAAFDGCSADAEAGFDTIIELAKKVDETNAAAVLMIENSDDAIAKTVISNTKNKNQQIFVMDSCQSVSLAEADKGKDYISVMRENLDVLGKVLYE